MIISFFYSKIIFFLLSILILPVSADTKIIAKSDDTLFKLSKQYGVSLKELMHKNNFNDANKIIGGELIIIPNKNEPLNHKVIEGDTLYKIARDYGVSIKDIISINDLDKETILKPNQLILLPNGAINEDVFSQEPIRLASKKVFYHQTSKGEKLIKIAKLHDISKEELILLNNLSDQINVSPNSKLKIRESRPSKWLKYGSLIINWSDWRYLDGNYITQAKNRKNKSFYLAINCERRALNNTLKNSDWDNWYFPNSNFEFRLINDFCDKNFEI